MKQYQGSLRSTLAAASGDSSLHFRQLSFSHWTHTLFTNSLLSRARSIELLLTTLLACFLFCFALFIFCLFFLRSEFNLENKKKYRFKTMRYNLNHKKQFFPIFCPLLCTWYGRHAGGTLYSADPQQKHSRHVNYLQNKCFLKLKTGQIY